MPNVLITAEAIRELPGAHLDLLRSTGYEVRFPTNRALLHRR